MKDIAASDRKAFLASLRGQKDRPQTFRAALWASRWSLVQWAFVFFVLAYFVGSTFGNAHSLAVLASGFGFFAGSVVGLRQSVKSWSWLSDVIDWGKVEREISEDSQSGG